MLYRPKGAVLRLQDILAKMEGRRVLPSKVVYTEQEKSAAKAVLHTLLATYEPNKVVSNKEEINQVDV